MRARYLALHCVGEHALRQPQQQGKRPCAETSGMSQRGRLFSLALASCNYVYNRNLPNAEVNGPSALRAIIRLSKIEASIPHIRVHESRGLGKLSQLHNAIVCGHEAARLGTFGIWG